MKKIYSMGRYIKQIRVHLGDQYRYDVPLDQQLREAGFSSVRYIPHRYYEIDDLEYTLFVLRFS